jgi:hypothetical protein
VINTYRPKEVKNKAQMKERRPFCRDFRPKLMNTITAAKTLTESGITAIQQEN